MKFQLIILKLPFLLAKVLEEVYKIYNSICTAYVNELLESVRNMYGARNKYNIVQIKCRTIKFCINSFTHEGVKLWNELILEFYHQLNILKVLWLLLAAEHVDVITVFYVYYIKCDYFIIYAHVTPLSHLHCTHPFTSIVHYNSVCFIVGQYYVTLNVTIDLFYRRYIKFYSIL